MQVGSNGIISFGGDYNPHENAEFTNSLLGEYLVAPFWDDINIDDDGGTISYKTFESGYYLEQVNAYIQRQRQNSFHGTWMMNVYYNQVAPFSGQKSRRVSFILHNYQKMLNKHLGNKHVEISANCPVVNCPAVGHS